MKTVRTICCKLTPTAKQAAEIDATLAAFAIACNHLAKRGAEAGVKGKFNLQRLCYHEVRANFGLSANLTIRAIARVAAAGTESRFNPTSADYDAHVFSFRESDWTFSLTLLHGRHRLAACLGDFQREALAGARPTSATLVKRDGGYFLHVQVKTEAPPAANANAFLGADLGIVNIATDSTGEAFSGEKVERNRRRRATARKQYQRKGTKSAKRRLRKLSGKQSRFQRWVNHNVSKRLVGKAKALGVGIALEDLSGIRDRCEQTASKSFRRRLGNWGFYQLRQFVEYKAKAAGVTVVLVDPAYSSQTCSVCGHRERANRKSQSEFRCKQCTHSMNSDENAALNISAWAARKPASKVSG